MGFPILRINSDLMETCEVMQRISGIQGGPGLSNVNVSACDFCFLIHPISLGAGLVLGQLSPFRPTEAFVLLIVTSHPQPNP